MCVKVHGAAVCVLYEIDGMDGRLEAVKAPKERGLRVECVG